MRIYVPDNLKLCHFFEQGPGGGCATTAYRDSTGAWTIGWGHKLLPSDPMIHKPIVLTQAAQLLDLDLFKAATYLSVCLGSVGKGLNDGQWGALVDFVFNLGVGDFEGSTLHDRLVHGDLADVPDQLLRWDHGRVDGSEEVMEGLRRRRAAEVGLWSNGTWSPVP